MAQSKPQFRTVEIALSAPFDGWAATMKAEGVPARILIDLQSGNAERAMNAIDRLITKHNFLTEDGEPASSIIDSPMDALTQTVEKWSEAVSALPPR